MTYKSSVARFHVAENKQIVWRR